MVKELQCDGSLAECWITDTLPINPFQIKLLNRAEKIEVYKLITLKSNRQEGKITVTFSIQTELKYRHNNNIKYI